MSLSTINLRERRRSSVNSLVPMPRLFLTSKHEPSPVFDEVDFLDSTTSTIIPSCSRCTTPTAPTSAHLRNPQIDIHCEDSLPPAYSIPSSPTSPLPSKRSSVSELLNVSDGGEPKHERLRWRLASGFLAYFLCGWGDGGLHPSFK